MAENPTFIALIRGINVGRAKRVAMADLRSLVKGIGGRNVRTILNSGNVVFEASRNDGVNLAVEIRQALERGTGISAAVIVLTARELAAIVAENPLLGLCDNPSRLLVATFAEPAGPELLTPLLDEDWRPEAIGLGPRCAYFWCPDGVLKSRLPDTIEGLVGDGVTMRNWSTISRLQTAVEDD